MPTTIAPSKRWTRSHSGTFDRRAVPTYPNGTLCRIERGRIVGAVQINPTSHLPPQLRSGPIHPAARSRGATAPIRLLIGDADGEFRRTLRASLAADPRVEVVGEADDGDVALRLLRRLRPDVALLDEDMPSFGGAAVARILRSELPDLRVVVLTRPVGGARR